MTITKDEVIAKLGAALAEEKRLREFGQSEACGQTHWESLRDVRRASATKTQRALDAYARLAEQRVTAHKQQVTELMAKARRLRHAIAPDYDAAYRSLETDLYNILQYIPKKADDATADN